MAHYLEWSNEVHVAVKCLLHAGDALTSFSNTIRSQCKCARPSVVSLAKLVAEPPLERTDRQAFTHHMPKRNNILPFYCVLFIYYQALGHLCEAASLRWMGA